MKILYLGNKLSKNGLNKTTIETLGINFENEGLSVFYASDKKSFSIRLLDMIKAVFQFRNQVSYILIDTYSTKAFWYAFVCSQLARFFNVKYIPILHGGDLPYRLKLNPKLCRMVFVNAYKNVAPSGYLKKAFEKEGYLNVIHIPNSIEIKNYEFKQRNEVNPRLLWVRAFANIYNPKMAVSVLFQLQKTYSNATLTMVGPDKDGSLITTKAFADQLGVKVNFTGKLSKEDWCRLAIDNDIFINTTHFDNMPVSVMEAMALGLPLVSTNVGGIPYLVSNNENAILVNDNDVEQMTTSILDLISDKEKAFNMSQNGRRLIEQIDWDIVKQKWFSLLK